jgi:hypothetical protein
MTGQAVLDARMGLADLQLALDWAEKEGWNPGLDDAAAFLGADPDGFFMRRIDGRPVSAISVVNHAPDFAFIGLFICLPEFRQLGHGYGLAQAVIGHAGARTIGLDGVAEQQENYGRAGFVAVGATLRHEGEAIPEAGVVRAVRAQDLDSLLDLDVAANGYRRPAFVAGWMTDTGSRRTLVQEDGGRITGAVTWRRSIRGTKVGPVYAQSTRDALGLIGAAAQSSGGAGPFVIDVPEANRTLRRELEALGYTVAFATARMYRGTPPQSGTALAAIATMELG